MRVEFPELHWGAVRFFLLAAVLAAIWLGLNILFPDLWSSGVLTAFTRLSIHATILAGLWLGLSRTDFTGSKRAALWLAIAVPYTIWLALAWGLALHGAFKPIPGLANASLLPVAIFVPVLIGLVLSTRSRHMAALLDVTPPSWLIGLQVYRIFGGGFLVSWMHGAIPGVFALPAGFGDITVGLLALPVAFRASFGTSAGRRAGIAWNLLGLTDFAIAISMGMLSSPGPLQILALNHPNVQLTTFPTVMVPAFAVPSLIILHGLSLWQLSRMGRKAASSL